MDFIIRLFRVLALESRLEMVQFIMKRPGSTVGEISSALSLPIPDTSRHLKLLSAHGVTDTRPSGTYLLASAGSPTDTTHVVLRRVRRLLRKYLKENALKETIEAVCPDCESPEWSNVLKAMCFEFTAYTHLRRLLILQMLCKQENADLLTIMQTIGMSHTAVCRQTNKLVRRGLLREFRSGKRYVVEIPKSLGTTFRASLFAGVRDYLVNC